MQLIDNGLPVVTLEVNSVETVLFRTISPSGEITWAGHPRVLTEQGERVCQFAIVMGSNGKITGSGAINFIAARGWGPRAVKALPSRKSEIYAELTAGVAMALASFSAMQEAQKDQAMADARALVAKALKQLTGFDALPGEMTLNDQIGLQAVGVPELILQAMNGANMVPVLALSQTVRGWINPNFAELRDGGWDDEAHRLALASGLPTNIVELMKAAGKTLARAA